MFEKFLIKFMRQVIISKVIRMSRNIVFTMIPIQKKLSVWPSWRDNFINENPRISGWTLWLKCLRWREDQTLKNELKDNSSAQERFWNVAESLEFNPKVQSQKRWSDIKRQQINWYQIFHGMGTEYGQSIPLKLF